jgi:hypothetical protein
VSTHYFRFTRRGAADRERAPLLERLLARADGSTAVADWRADAFRLIAPTVTSMPGVGPVALFSDVGAVDAASVFLAAPVHYVAGMSNVRLPAGGILSLRRPEADLLAADFNRVWKDAGIRLIAGRRADLYCLVDRALDVTTYDPEEVLDRRIEDHQPGGAAAPRLRALMSEIEMWLFEHPVNRTRTSNAEAVVNGLWLWGGGSALSSLPSVDGWTAGDDPFFNGFATESEASHGAASGVVVTADIGSHRLERSVADLRAGRIARLVLSAGSRCFNVGARWKWRLWRRHRPWVEYFA